MQKMLENLFGNMRAWKGFDRSRIEKIYIKLAKEMNEKFPQHPISDCYRLIKSRHIYNLKAKKNERENDYDILMYKKSLTQNKGKKS